MSVIDEYRRRILGTWLDWRSFRRDRRLILRHPYRIGEKKRVLKNGPLQFAIHALIPTLALAWVFESIVVVIGDLPPTRYERFLEEYRVTAERSEERGLADLARADSIFAVAPDWLSGRDSTELRALSETMESRLEALGLDAPEDPALARAEELARNRYDSLARLARATLERDVVLEWLESHEHLMAAMARTSAALDSTRRVLQHGVALAESLTHVEHLRGAHVTHDLGEVERGMMDDYRQAESRHEASERADALLDRFEAVLVVTTVLLNALVFGIVFSRLFPTTDRDAPDLYLYSVGAALLWPNVAYVIWFIGRDLADRFELVRPWLVDAAIHSGVAVFALLALGRAARMIAEVVNRRDSAIQLEKAEPRILLALVGSQILTGFCLVLLSEGMVAVFGAAWVGGR